MPDHPENSAIYRISELSPRRPLRFELVPDAATRHAIAADLGLLGLRKLRFAGTLSAEGKADWRLEADLGATVTQPCVISLEPVTTRIQEHVTRRFLHDWPPPEEQGDEVEMPEDESIDPLGEKIDLMAVMTEALALALPPYPRAPGAEPAASAATPPGAAPLDDEVLRPFAALEGLKKKLEDEGG